MLKAPRLGGASCGDLAEQRECLATTKRGLFDFTLGVATSAWTAFCPDGMLQPQSFNLYKLFKWEGLRTGRSVALAAAVASASACGRRLTREGQGDFQVALLSFGLGMSPRSPCCRRPPFLRATAMRRSWV